MNEESREELPSYWLDLYKITTEMADRISQRRASANTFLLSVHTGLAAFVAALTAFMGGRKQAHFGALPVYITCTAGMALAVAWLMLLRSYRQLNGAKFAVIHRLEAPMEVQPFAEEWDQLKSRSLSEGVRLKRLRYLELGVVEQVVPVVFGAIYLTVALVVGCGS